MSDSHTHPNNFSGRPFIPLNQLRCALQIEAEVKELLENLVLASIESYEYYHTYRVPWYRNRSGLIAFHER